MKIFQSELSSNRNRPIIWIGILMNQQTTLTFYSVLNHSDIRKTFVNYLKKQKKDETWLFIIATQYLESLVKQSNKTRAIKQLKHILTFYVDEKKPNLTIEGVEQKLLTNLYEQKQKENLDQLYPLIIELKSKLLTHFERNEFKSFITTEDAQKLCKTYEMNKLLVLPVLSQEYEYKDEDFEKISLESRDLEYFKRIEKENSKDWELLHETENLKTFLSFQNYFPNVSFLEIPQIIRSEAIYECSFQEAAMGILHKFFENNPICVFFKTVHFQENQFIVDVYCKRPSTPIKVTRMVCTLRYEDDSIYGLMKPLKIPELDFIKLQPMKFFKNGTEIEERGVQDFFYFGFRIIKFSETKTILHTNTVFQGTYGCMGVPKSLIVLRAGEYHKQFSLGVQHFKGKKINEFKEEFNKTKYGLPSDPFVKLLYDLNVEPSTNFLNNILGELKSMEKKNSNCENCNFLENICSKMNITLKTNEKEEKIVNINENILEGELFNNIIKTMKPEVLNFDEKFSELKVTFSDLEMSEMDESSQSENEFLEVQRIHE
jgi:hypothetical protein